jgi:prepilin signal peptidase PulO-like enzyme (type II secretory pathway)
MVIASFFILGLIIGSFLNVVVLRLQASETLMGRSMCPHCRRQIRWYDNVPLLSFLLLKGRCRDCKAPISWQYPAVELATGLVFVVTGHLLFSLADPRSWLDTIFYLALFSALIVIFVYDLLSMYIPMAVLWFATGLTLVYRGVVAVFFSASAGIWSELVPYMWSAVGAFLFFFILVVVSKETWMGMGDAYVGLLMGLVLGWPGIIWALNLAFGLGAVAGVALVLARRKKMKSQVPFAPFLVIGLFLTFLLSNTFSPALQSLFSY